MKRGAARWSAIITALAAAGLLAACGQASPSLPAAVPYDGPLWVAPSTEAKLWEDPGAAGRAIDCDFRPIGKTNASPYNTGEVGDSPEDALRIAWKESQFDGLYEELMIAKDEGDRRLYVVQQEGRTYQALIFRRGPATKGTGVGPDGVGWWLESFARCDIAEFPGGLAEQRGWEIWTDARGRRQPIHVINSHLGADCVEGARFLEIGNGRPGDVPAQYVANADRFPEFFAERYRAHLRLPRSAVPSPYRHGAERLWLSADRRRAYVGADASDVALWPRTTQLLGCA